MPALPKSSEEAVQAMEHVPGEYKKYLARTINSMYGQAIVFVSPRAQQAVQEAEVKFISADATFNIVPKIFYQFFSLMGEIKGQMLPLGYALMSGKEEGLYLAVVEELKLALGEQHFQPSQAVSDYEPAIGNALESHFPELTVTGCSFHFSKSLYGRIAKLHLTPLYYQDESFRSWARMLMSLPLLPPNLIKSVYKDLIKGQKDCPQWAQKGVRSFKKYVTSYWLERVKPEKLSVFQVERRTNNHLESYHRWLKGHIPPVSAKLNLWVFVSRLNDFISSMDLDFERLAGGLKVHRPMPRSRMAAEEQLKELKKSLLEGEISPLCYLVTAKATIGGKEQALAEQGGAESGEEDYESAEENDGDADKENTPPVCMICLAEPVKIILLPCAHAKFCIGCGSGLGVCPLCSAAVVQTIEVIL